MPHSVKLDFTSVQMVGRDEELQQLLAAFQRACDASIPSTCAILIQGALGVGKTFLVDAFWEQAQASPVQPSSLFCRGEFEQCSSASDPFSAVAESFSTLIASLVESECWKERFADTLSAELAVLGTIIPWFQELAIETDVPLSSPRDLGNSNRRLIRNISQVERKGLGLERISFALRALLRCITSHTTLVMVLDDLQWAGREALVLLQTLLSDQKLSGRFLFVGTHSPVAQSHSLQDLSSELLDKQRLLQMQLSNLTIESLSVLLCSRMRRGKDELESLAEVIQIKTGGNPFFVIRFIQLLEERGLLFYSLQTYRWEWDCARIHLEMNISDNVLDVLATSLREMPDRQQMAVRTAACLHVSHFDVDELFHILAVVNTNHDGYGDCEQSQNVEKEKIEIGFESVEELRAVLLGAAQDGLLEETSSGWFKFAHDRIRQVAYSLLPEGCDRQGIHLRIGRQLRRWIRDLTEQEDRLDRLLFQTAGQLNLGAKLITCDAERKDLAELNYQAAELAGQQSSFFPASDFLRASFDIMGDHPWVEHYDLCMKVSIAQMRIEYCCGRPVVSAYVADDVLDHARTFQDKKAAYHTKIMWLTQDGKSKEAMDLVLSVLEELGAPFPKRLLRLHVKKEMMRTKKMLHARTDAELLELPDAENEKLEEIAEFLAFLGELALDSSAKGSPEYLALMLLRLIQITLEHGRFAFTSTCYIAWGWFSARVGCFDEADRFGKLGLMIAAQGKGGYHDTRAVLFYHLEIYHWKLPYHEGLMPTSNALRTLWDQGAIEYVFLHATTYLGIYFCCGLRLEPLQRDILKYVDLLRDYGSRLSFETHAPFFQMISNLMGNSNETTVLSGEFMNEDDSVQKWSRTGNDTALQRMYFHRIMLAYYFNDLELAGQMFEKMSSPCNECPDLVSSFSTT
jgi:predicted ATPase